MIISATTRPVSSRTVDLAGPTDIEAAVAAAGRTFDDVAWAAVPASEAGAPAGVVNLLLGDGPSVGSPLVSHPGVDMVSFTGGLDTGQSIIKWPWWTLSLGCVG
jgi:acyl-CoA reductase-like NAD-dependent aldehyde dehydrogenase